MGPRTTRKTFILLIFFFGTQWRRSHFSLPVLALIFPACSLVSSRLIYWETISALLSKLKNYGFDQLVSQRNWHHLLDEKLGFVGTCLPRRNVCSGLYDGRVGEVANRVSSGSFRGGHWRYLPIRNHDNRSGMRLLAPRLNNRNLIFFGSPEPALNPGKSTAVRRSCIPPPFYRHLLITNYYTYTHIQTYIKICIHLPTPDPSPPSLWTTSLTSGSVSSAGNGCGTRWLLAGAGLLPLLQSRVSMVYVLFVAEVFFLFSHCTPQGA